METRAIERNTDDINEQKKSAIIGMLRIAGASSRFTNELTTAADIKDFNGWFLDIDGNLGQNIQSPGRWRKGHLEKCFRQKRLEQCDVNASFKVKWSFNAKPDLVIQPDCDHALCIELKLDFERT